MSNEIKLCLCFSLMLPNHSITFWVFFHWFKFRIFLKLELILSRMILLSFPDSLFAGLISRHFGLFSKFSLWSLREINASRFFICSIRSPIPKLFEICFSSLCLKYCSKYVLVRFVRFVSAHFSKFVSHLMIPLG